MINLSPPGARGSAYIVLLLCAFLGQQAMWYYVTLDPLGRWNVVCEKSPDWHPEGGPGAQVLRAGALGLAPFGLCFLPVASGVF